LTAGTVNGSGNKARSGAHTLSLLAVPLNGQLLRSLATGPKRQVELRRECGSPALSTLRAHLKELERIGAIVKQRRNAFPGSLEYELAEPGRGLLFVMSILERWLRRTPDEALELGSDPARAVVKALVDGWSSTMIRALAGGPRSLTELDRLIGAYNYPSLERRLGAMRTVGLVAATDRGGSGTPYAVSDWLRGGVAPLIVASRWERRNLPDETARIGRIDAEAALMLTVPLVRLPRHLAGVCRLVVETSNGSASRPAAVTVAVKDERAALHALAAESSVDALATGPVAAWFRAAIEADPNHLELGGDRRLAKGLLASFYNPLFGSRTLIRSQAIT
jgi:DNA-binding HxlR family transcriptional regulator